jgi:hyperosmotically inducible periplasmic protein
MKTKLAIACLMAGTLLAPIASFAAEDADTARADAKTYVKDSAITTAIKAKLAAEHPASLAQIHVDTDANGVVWLSGTARSQAEIDRVVSIASGTEHVVAVKNHLTVKKAD